MAERTDRSPSILKPVTTPRTNSSDDEINEAGSKGELKPSSDGDAVGLAEPQRAAASD